MGLRLIPRLLERGHEVRALVRAGSEKKLPPGCVPVLGNALDGNNYVEKIAPADTFVQLVGVAHPSPAKAKEFRKVDLVSGLGAVMAAKGAGIRHFVYLSVAHPAPMMKEYIAVRAECEAGIQAAGLNATILRPWYVLGPGHWWPYLLVPMYKKSRTAATNPRGCAAAGAGDFGANGNCTVGRSGKSARRNQGCERARDPLGKGLKSLARSGV